MDIHVNMLPVFRKIKCRFCQAYEIASAGRVRLGGIIDKYYYINKLLEYTNTRSCTFDPFAQILSYITTLKSEHSKYFFKSVANAQDIFNATLCEFWIFYYSTNTSFLVHKVHFLRIFFNVMENFSRFFLNFKMYYHTHM